LTASILNAIIALTSCPLAASQRIAMKQMNFPPDLANDSDLERIKARIRGQRFVLLDKKRIIGWSTGIGTACGVLLGIWVTVSHYVYSVTKVPSGVFGLAVDLVVGTFIAGLLGAVVGVGLGRIVVGFVRFFHPTYVALCYSPEEFELQYGDKPPKIG
jgi:hypothetical protein